MLLMAAGGLLVVLVCVDMGIKQYIEENFEEEEERETILDKVVPVLPKQNIRRCFPVSKHIMQGTGKSFIKSKMHLPPPQKKLDAGPRSIAVGRLKMLAVPGSISTL